MKNSPNVGGQAGNYWGSPFNGVGRIQSQKELVSTTKEAKRAARRLMCTGKGGGATTEGGQ